MEAFKCCLVLRLKFSLINAQNFWFRHFDSCSSLLWLPPLSILADDAIILKIKNYMGKRSFIYSQSLLKLWNQEINPPFKTKLSNKMEKLIKTPLFRVSNRGACLVFWATYKLAHPSFSLLFNYCYRIVWKFIQS